MNPWKPKYKALHDTIDNIRGAIQLLAVAAVMAAILMLTL